MTDIRVHPSEFTDDEKNLYALLLGFGYKEIRIIDGKFYGIRRMIFTTGVFCELDACSVNNGRICFETWQEASDFLSQWDGKADPASFYPRADKRTRK